MVELSLYAFAIAWGILGGIYFLPNYLDMFYKNDAIARAKHIMKDLCLDSTYFIVFYSFIGLHVMAIIIICKWLVIALFDVEVLARGTYLE